ncbi:P-loop containing nucleoside triphosphate hydrolase protein [Rhizophagus clarus]|uniref:P-loop containing nucleoside triphosphate hydrolase protein n=1 Tax=Rhizophagus clarus TaxID=94130 RepID=A0A8H3MEB8_9GLOM|nr:P-loop containing nucleoside triphosphate hydrolase protein [Rhizophagus clarus]
MFDDDNTNAIRTSSSINQSLILLRDVSYSGNWLKLTHHINIVSQWHLNHIGKDGDPHHLYCDFAIKFNSSTFPIAILELVVTASSTDLERHYIRILNIPPQLCPDEIWVIYFSCEDNFVPYWPRKRLQKRA